MPAIKTPTPIRPELPDATLDPVANPVLLGTITYGVKPTPISRVKAFKVLWLDTFAKVAGLVASGDWSNTDVVDALLGIVLDAPYELLHIVIPDLDKADLEEHLTVPQLLDAADTILAVNRLGVLKQAVPFVQDFLKRQTLARSMERARDAYTQALAAETALQEQKDATPSA